MHYNIGVGGVGVGRYCVGLGMGAIVWGCSWVCGVKWTSFCGMDFGGAGLQVCLPLKKPYVETSTE